ncbi:SAM hydrolase/SAM-dependent halogenase family protein [Methermicoccus shengliensis]|uniref:SAM-dependent chlorinase/fluorinase n=1 Tax=Methermicoccus shengliensis TaxID=660064 RepID=A0A832RTN5_9EURY|nr:SAM-dependent chlorinase/fluorinase [Methermicoccus shengliensis]KUK04777.1 MAG: Uncharacterized protein XD46_0478 [Euryarchaeota archaeon 55_53]KUK29937.1 MAG: Uncharacterized protein XD62_1004 [Methanosarcinales archeaon 56_1174]MDI3487694.1 hypothetical protein [Methanosarcinales archaeon]MDN5295542.1 hypothetical protein [Methanosarcinales archaeon]HIH70303.1 SAM-dependent chlorinase/fluorinase [Methermicoccus shengliensis]
MITLTTDFGTLYPAALKGAILALSPNAKIVDVSHEVPRGNVVAGALFLRCASVWFPDAIHVCVLGSEVRGRSRMLVVRTKRGTLVGPDSGVLCPAAEVLGGGELFELDGTQLWERAQWEMGSGVEYAVAAAMLENGVSPSEMGMPTQSIVELTLEHVHLSGEEVHTKVLYVDGFGNLVLAIPNSAALPSGRGTVRGHPFLLTDSYEQGRLVLYRGTLGFFELALGGGSASHLLGVREGDELVLELSEESGASW